MTYRNTKQKIVGIRWRILRTCNEKENEKNSILVLVKCEMLEFQRNYVKEINIPPSTHSCQRFALIFNRNSGAYRIGIGGVRMWLWNVYHVSYISSNSARKVNQNIWFILSHAQPRRVAVGSTRHKCMSFNWIYHSHSTGDENAGQIMISLSSPHDTSYLASINQCETDSCENETFQENKLMPMQLNTDIKLSIANASFHFDINKVWEIGCTR